MEMSVTPARMSPARRQLQEQEVKRMLKEDAERAEKAKAKDPMAQLEEEREEVDAGKS